MSAFISYNRHRESDREKELKIIPAKDHSLWLRALSKTLQASSQLVYVVPGMERRALFMLTRQVPFQLSHASSSLYCGGVKGDKYSPYGTGETARRCCSCRGPEFRSNNQLQL